MSRPGRQNGGDGRVRSPLVIAVALHRSSPGQSSADSGGSVARSGALLLLALVSAAGLLLFVDDRYAVGTWLAWPMLRIWAWQALLNLSWVCAGIALTLRVSPSGLYPLERLCVGVATGVIAFALSLYLLGALGLFRPEPATVLPFLFVAAGGPVTYQWWRRLPQANATDRRIQLTWLSLGIAMFGAVWTVALYLGVLSPDTVSYDARWMHLCIAQDYAREGRLVPFPGDWVKAYPHLFSVVQTWNFLVPGFSEPATRWMIGRC